MLSLVYKRLPNVVKLQQNAPKCTTFTVNRYCSSSNDGWKKKVVDNYDDRGRSLLIEIEVMFDLIDTLDLHRYNRISNTGTVSLKEPCG